MCFYRRGYSLNNVKDSSSKTEVDKQSERKVEEVLGGKPEGMDSKKADEF